MPLFDLKTNCPVVNFHCNYFFSCSDSQMANCNAFVVQFISSFCISLFLLLHIALANIYICTRTNHYSLFGILFIVIIVAVHVDKQPKFRNLLQMSYGHEFVFHFNWIACCFRCHFCWLHANQKAKKNENSKIKSTIKTKTLTKCKRRKRRLG